jgi:hypothetical protein
VPSFFLNPAQPDPNRFGGTRCYDPSEEVESRMGLRILTERETKQIRGALSNSGRHAYLRRLTMTVLRWPINWWKQRPKQFIPPDRSDPGTTGALGPQLFSRTRTQSAAPLLFAAGVVKV